jgi:hypothetical protein
MIGRPACLLGMYPCESVAAEVKFVDEDIDHANGVVLGYVVVQMLRKQSTLSTVLTFDKAFHCLVCVLQMLGQ